MKTRICLLVVGLLMLNTMAGQQSWAIRTNFGVTSGSDAIDGYYFSFDIGIPIFKGFQLSPTFTYADMLPNTYFFNSWDNNYLTPVFGYPTGGPRQEQEYGASLGSVALLILFLPFDLSNNENLSKHELIIGAGYSFNSYTMVSTRYVINGNVEVIGFSTKSNKSLEPYYGKLAYNYLLNKKVFIGFTASMIGYDGEGELFAGAQLGVKF